MAPVEMPSLDDTIAYTLKFLHERFVEGKHKNASNYGYDLYARETAEAWATMNAAGDSGLREDLLESTGPIFLEAAWEITRRGILRPGFPTLKQGVSGPTRGDGYSLTTNGKHWLKNASESDFVILLPGSLAAAFAGFSDRYGDGYHQRTQEAIACRRAEAWLACCAMAGAAAESILLAVAIGKTGDIQKVMTVYKSSSGRKKTIDLVVENAPSYIRDNFKTFMGLLSFWRDEAAHGEARNLSTANADEALRQLLHMSQWIDRSWTILTK
jgi:hypothetical protein